MFKLTRADLAKKTDAQLSLLFHQAQTATPPTPRLRAAFKAALALIRQEIQARKLSLK